MKLKSVLFSVVKQYIISYDCSSTSGMEEKIKTKPPPPPLTASERQEEGTLDE